MFDLSDIVSLEKNKNDKIKRILEFLKDFLKIANAYFLDNDFNFYNKNKKFNYDFSHLLAKNNIFQCHNRGDLMTDYKPFAIELENNDILSFVIIKIIFNNKQYGYLILSDRITQHIWQDEEISLGVFASKMISTELELNKN